nr:RagB/SusD family nutrient uptake outer membrane protein [uncultured Pedobacter sp.]
MLNKKIYTIFLSVLLLTQVSCSKYEQEPLNVLTEDLVYDEMDVNAFYAEQVLNNLYTYLPTGFNRIDGVFLGAATDDAIASANVSEIQALSLGRQSPSSTVDQIWVESYQGIRKVNIFLSKIDRVPLKEETKTNWKAEARFIRAMIYFEMIKRYGGVPLLGDRVMDITDNFNIPRNSFDQCEQYILDELNAIKGKLRVEDGAVTDPNFGHITQGAALALKSRLFLYAASPLNNPDNNLVKWDSAYVAAKAVMDLPYYGLLTGVGANAGAPAFRNVFITRKNKEVILAYQQPKNQSLERQNAPIGFSLPSPGNGAMSPTQELVDAFPTITGMPIDKNSATYKADPYSNRDPRMGVTIFYNGSQWLKRPVETFDGGLDRPGGSVLQTRTGYYLRKFMADFSNAAAYSNQDHNFIIFRYAEILLNFAEAANELGKTSEALTQLRAIRSRAGITPGLPTNQYGLPSNLNQNDMREAIRLERRIELAFEDQRFWDMRRWKLAETAFNTTLHGIKITQNGNALDYQEEEVSPLLFLAPKMYLYPIPNLEILKTPALVQNPEWTN